MKYLAFFKYDNFKIVQEALEMSKGNRPSDLWIQLKEEKYKYELMKNSDELITIDDYYSMPQAWIIYNGIAADSPIQLPLINGTTLQVVEELFQELSCRFEWCLFNWGATHSLSALGLISSSEETVNQFLNIYIQVFSKETSYILNSPLLSKYSVCDKFKEHFRALLIDFSPNNVGVRIWKACSCDQKFPWIVSSRENIEFDRDTVRLIQELEFIVKGDGGRQMRKRRLKVIEPQNIEIFNQFCSEGYSFDSTIIAIPSGSSLDHLLHILSETELHDGDNHDLQMIDSITSQFDWLYGISRDYTDDRYSLFFSNNSSLLQAIDSMQLNDGYQLISCF